jgi:SAM-dependent methyltransferase
MAGRTDEVWTTPSLVAVYLEGVRGAIPLAQEQIDIMLRLITACGGPIRSFLDLGCGDGVLSAAILQRYPQAEGVLVDFSAPMLDAARVASQVRTSLFASPTWTTASHRGRDLSMNTVRLTRSYRATQSIISRTLASEKPTLSFSICCVRGASSSMWSMSCLLRIGLRP